MKKIRFLFTFLVCATMIACSNDDFESLLSTDLTSKEFSISFKKDTISFNITTNDKWSITELPDWITFSINGEKGKTATIYDAGNKKIMLLISENINYERRKGDVPITTVNNVLANIHIEQAKQPKLIGYWILSEGYLGKNNSELAWYDIKEEKLLKKRFKEINGKELGDTGNDLKIYGKKMYCVVSGPGFGAASTQGTNYIEVINPQDGKSIKRIAFTNAEGKPAKPREIIFEGGYGYISSYSNEVVRLDTVSLSIDAHAALSGTLAEGLCYEDGNIYVCNSGQGKDNKISVVNANSMKETEVISTVKNPTNIINTGNGVVYFCTGYADYKLYEITTSNQKITEVEGFYASDFTYFKNDIYGCSFDWNTYKGNTYRYSTIDKTTSTMNINLVGAGIPMLMEYHIGIINGTKDLYLTGMGQDIVIFEAKTGKINYVLKTGTANGSSVVAVFD